MKIYGQSLLRNFLLSVREIDLNNKVVTDDVTNFQ